MFMLGENLQESFEPTMRPMHVHSTNVQLEKRDEAPLSFSHWGGTRDAEGVPEQPLIREGREKKGITVCADY